MTNYLWIIGALALISPAGARAPRAPRGEIVLPMDAPVIAVEMAGVPLRLRVGLEAKDVVEINADVIARLPLRFEDGFDAEVGRETIKGVTAIGELRIGKTKRMVQLSSHGRSCCDGVDGEIGIGLLPYATVRFLRDDVVGSPTERSLPVRSTIERGLEAVPADSTVAIQFAPTRDRSVATAAAGAILARRLGGAPEGESFEIPAAFGVTRPARRVRFGRPADIAGFSFAEIPVRMTDFGGRETFVDHDSDPGDIVVQRRIKRQEAWPVVMLARDRLNRCAEIQVDVPAQRMTLRCAFD
ncbi:hypothetical protein [Sphingomonas montanisoli]|uniref:Uncharacterized protein n=1 Tax=Sphingomonas montanisoli TaxID=2606412 RepID=A0A5D9CBU5_9SPHN|nr:hypothetical protein [Sphingomonas montanisoli]TZG28632.1 hypothetical protein FYJ91_00310 [Sphingomonas montanisoli]